MPIRNETIEDRRDTIFFSLTLGVNGHIWACLPNGELFVFENGVYVANGRPEQIIKSYTVQELGLEYTKNDYEQILDRIKGSNPQDYDFFENVPLNLICVGNGILDLKTYTLQPWTATIPFLNKTPVNFDPEVKCPLIEQKISEWLESSEHILAMFEFIGFCLWREYTFEKAFFFVGEGENGKTTLLNVIVAFLGAKNVSHIPIQELGDHFKTVLLYGKLANIADELSVKALQDSSKFKELTGRSPMYGYIKYHQFPKQFQSYAKQIYATNQLPQISDTSHAFFRRPQIFNFLNVFSKENGKRDEHLIEKLTTPTELSGLLNLALEGLKRLQTNGKFSVESESFETQELWSLDLVQEFVLNELEEDRDSQTTFTELYNAFLDYCKNKEQQPINPKSFALRLRKYVSFKKVKQQKDEVREYVYLGIRLKEKPNSQQTLAKPEGDFNAV